MSAVGSSLCQANQDDVALGYISIKEASFQWKNHTKVAHRMIRKNKTNEEQTKNAEQSRQRSRMVTMTKTKTKDGVQAVGRDTAV